MLFPRARSAFTKLDLLASVAALALLVIAVAPGFGNASRNSERAVCINNLQQIGSGFAQFWGDHGNQTPWQAARDPWGETSSELTKAYGHFSMLSNYVSGPRVFADPADDRPDFRIAINWSMGIGGLFRSNYRDNSVSYFVGVDVNRHTPDLLLAGDHNVTFTGSGGCGSGFSSVAHLSSGSQGSAWRDSVHRLSGNLLFCDGSVRQTNTRMLRDAILGQNYPPGLSLTQHVIPPEQ